MTPNRPLSGYHEYVWKHGVFNDPVIHYNSRCEKCGRVEFEMFRVGSNLIFCADCFSAEFLGLTTAEEFECRLHEWRVKYLDRVRKELADG